MTDNEFEVMDELYFVQAFSDLQQQVALPETELKEILRGLLEKKWIKCLASPDHELTESEMDFANRYHTYYYLATKTGLLAHNTR